MPTELPRVMVTFPPDVMARIDRWKDKNGILSRSQAVRTLVTRAIAEEDKKETEER